MLVETIPINGVTAEAYDAFLASGWFRGSGFIYRSDLLCLDESVFSVEHIRVVIDNFSEGSKQRKILRRGNGSFRVEIGLPFITPEKEELYRKHSVKFKAFVHETLEEIIYEHAHNPEVVTMEMTVLDGERIVAVSYFDIGVDSMASLLCVYDEAYSRFSPGHYTMLREIEYARTRNVKYYYPGYVLDQPSSFDYKLTLGALERLTKEKVWVKSVDYVRGESTADVIRYKMKELKVMLSSAGIVSEFRVYPYFSLSFVMPARAHLLHFPCYYEFNIGAKTYAAAYDVLNNKFAVCRIQETTEVVFRHHLLLSEEYQQSHVYELRVMRSYKPTSWKVFVEQLNERNKAEEKAIWK